MFWKSAKDLSSASEEDAAEFKRLLGDYTRIVINAFSLNVFLLLIVVLSYPSRNRSRTIEVWKCLRFGVLMLFWLLEFYLIKLFEMYTYWARILYQEESMAVFETPTGGTDEPLRPPFVCCTPRVGDGSFCSSPFRTGIIYGLVVFCVVIGSLALVNEALFNLAEEPG